MATADHVSNGELVAVLEPALRAEFGRSKRITHLSRSLSEYRSSFAIEELEVEFSDGEGLPVIFKNFASHSLLAEARHTRPTFLYNNVREIEVYRRVLPSLRMGTARCYASEIDPARQRFWLFLEKVEGRELYQIGEFDVWEQVASWIARLHTRVEDLCARANQAQLLVWNADLYQLCLDSARSMLSLKPDTEPEAISRVLRTYESMIETLLKTPRCFIHGEYYASNIITQDTFEGVRVCPIDWETAGVGPGLFDLAALVAGKWTESQREALAFAYWECLDEAHRKKFGSHSAFHMQLLCCRLHLAVQLLGRPPDWKPPAEHRQDWLKEADWLITQLSS